MPPLARENPFLSGLREAADVTARTTEVVNEVRRKEAVSRFMQNMTGVSQAIEEREAQRASAFQKRIDDFIKRDKAERTGANAQTADQMFTRMYEDQLTLAAEQQAYEMEQAKDAAMARSLVSSGAYVLSQMTPGEQKAVDMLMGDSIGAATSRLLGGRGRGAGGFSMPKLPDPTDMYDFKEIKTSTGTRIGRVNKLTGRFEEQDAFEDPEAAIDLQLKQYELAAKPLEIESKLSNMDYVRTQTEKMRQDMIAGTTKVMGYGNNDLLERVQKAPAGFADMPKEQQEAFLAMQAATIPGTKAYYDQASGNIILRGMASNIKPSSGGGGGGGKEARITPNKIVELKTKLATTRTAITNAKTDEEKRGKMAEYNAIAKILNEAEGSGIKYFETNWKTRGEHEQDWTRFTREYKRRQPNSYAEYKEIWDGYSREQKAHFGNSFDRFVFHMRKIGK